MARNRENETGSDGLGCRRGAELGFIGFVFILGMVAVAEYGPGLLNPVQPVQAAAPEQEGMSELTTESTSQSPDPQVIFMGSDEKSENVCRLNAAYPEEILQWRQLVEDAGNAFDLDPNLIAAMILQESSGDSNAYSKSGAVGLMQVMPRDGIAAGFMCINGPCFADRPPTEELLKPAINIAYGSGMLAGLIERYGGDVREALKAYGPKDVGYYYADNILEIWSQYQDDDGCLISWHELELRQQWVSMGRFNPTIITTQLVGKGFVSLS